MVTSHSKDCLLQEAPKHTTLSNTPAPTACLRHFHPSTETWVLHACVSPLPGQRTVVLYSFTGSGTLPEDVANLPLMYAESEARLEGGDSVWMWEAQEPLTLESPGSLFPRRSQNSMPINCSKSFSFQADDRQLSRKFFLCNSVTPGFYLIRLSVHPRHLSGYPTVSLIKRGKGKTFFLLLTF